MQPHRQSSARRTWTKRIVLCVVIGAVLQYGVAVGYSLHRPDPKSVNRGYAQIHQRGSTASLSVSTGSNAGKNIITVVINWNGPSPEWITAVDWTQADWRWLEKPPHIELPRSSRFRTFTTTWRSADLPMPPSQRAAEVLSGWPWRSASYLTLAERGEITFLLSGGLRFSGEKAAWRDMPPIIPLRIIWPGALANTALYGAALFLLFLPRAARRLWRARRGHCVICNYDLRANTTGVCPECGTAVQKRTTQGTA